MNTGPSVLVVDDNQEVARSHASMVEELGFKTYVQTDPRKVQSQLTQAPEIQIALLDLHMPYLDGLELLKRIKIQKPQIGVVMATVVNDIEQAVKATKCGAYNYLLKPLKIERLKRVLDSFIRNRPASISSDPRLSNFITCHSSFEEIFRRLKMFAEADVTVLIEGETGTGKELIAGLLHTFSSRCEEPYIPINMAALSDQLFESELFGHRKGSYTGALTDHAGYFDVAQSGTLFLDEIGELGQEQQKKLLRVLQSHSYSRLGETHSRPLKARVVLATNRNLREEIRDKQFRDDLYYRLSSHVISLPPLRERQGDVMLLARYFLEKYNTQYGRNIEDFESEVLDMLSRYPFPGNVRELEGIISGAVLIEQTPHIQVSALPAHIRHERMEQTQGIEASRYREVMKTMAECNGNQTEAAKRLGIARGTLNRWLREFRDKGQVSGQQ